MYVFIVNQFLSRTNFVYIINQLLQNKLFLHSMIRYVCLHLFVYLMNRFSWDELCSHTEECQAHIEQEADEQGQVLIHRFKQNIKTLIRIFFYYITSLGSYIVALKLNFLYRSQPTQLNFLIFYFCGMTKNPQKF